jgi:hypothetical protein
MQMTILTFIYKMHIKMLIFLMIEHANIAGHQEGTNSLIVVFQYGLLASERQNN